MPQEVRNVELEKRLTGAKVELVDYRNEHGEEYLILGFDNGARLYVDAPTLYVPDKGR